MNEYLLKRGDAYEEKRGIIFKNTVVVVPLTFVHLFVYDHSYSSYDCDSTTSVYYINGRFDRHEMSLSMEDANQVSKSFGFRVSHWGLGCGVKAPSGYSCISVTVDLPELHKIDAFCETLRKIEKQNSLLKHNAIEQRELDNAAKQRHIEELTCNLKMYFCGECDK